MDALFLSRAARAFALELSALIDGLSQDAATLEAIYCGLKMSPKRRDEVEALLVRLIDGNRFFWLASAILAD